MFGYPKDVTLNDGTSVLLDVKQVEDLDESARFFAKMHPEDSLYLRRDVSKREILEERANELRDGRAFRLAAFIGNEMIGEASLYHPIYGWTQHVAEMRVLVPGKFQGNGLGKILIQEIFCNAVRLKYAVIEAYIIQEQQKVIAMLKRMGFKEIGVLKNHALDVKNRKHHVVIMTFNVDAMWKDLSDYYHSFEIYKT